MTGEDQYALFEFDEATSEVDEDVAVSYTHLTLPTKA